MEWSYVAGYFDGEGSARFKATLVEISFANTHTGSLNAIKDFIGCGTIYKHWSKERDFIRASKCYTLSISRHQDVLRVAKEMLPHSIIKAEKLAVLIQYIETKVWSNRSRAFILQHSNITKELLETLYWKEGKTFDEIGAIYGVKHSAVMYQFDKFGIPSRKRGAGPNTRRDALGRVLPKLKLSVQIA